MTTDLRTTRISIDDLRETYDEVVAAGSQRAVALARGWHQAKVKHRVSSYMRHAGIEGPPPGIVSQAHSRRAMLSHSGTGHRSAFRRGEERIAELEAEVVRLTREVAHWKAEAHPWAAIHAKLDAIAARPSGIFQPDHRRVADGGRTVKDQKRQARRVA